MATHKISSLASFNMGDGRMGMLAAGTELTRCRACAALLVDGFKDDDGVPLSMEVTEMTMFVRSSTQRFIIEPHDCQEA